MAFMQMETTGKVQGVEVETVTGETFFFPGDVWDDMPEGEYKSADVTWIVGYFGRYSAPGYLDCTDWHFDTSLEALEMELQDAYGDDDDDDGQGDDSDDPTSVLYDYRKCPPFNGKATI